MAVEWTTAALDSLCELIADCPHSTPVWTPSGVIVLRSQNIRGGRLDLSNPSYTDEEHFQDRIRRAEPTGGDLVITREAPMGEVCQVPPGLRCCLGQRMVLLRPDRSQADGRFLLFALQSRAVQTQIMWAEGTGSTVSNLRIPDLKKLRIPSPPLPEQRAIAHILGTLDDKIELNRRRNLTLEAMARTLFQDWFIDFGPVRAKVEGQEPYLPADLWQLFPERLHDGVKPEGWEYRPVSDFAELKGGKQLEKEQIAPAGQVPVFGGAGVMGYTDNHNADGFVIAVGRVGAYCGQFFAHRGKAWINNNASLIRQTDDRFGEWLFLSLQHADIDVIKKGAAQPFVSNGDIAKLPLMWPGDNVVHAFLDIVVPVLKKKEQNDAETNALAQLRDTLMPKLISGALSITNAEKFMELTAVRNRMEVTAG